MSKAYGLPTFPVADSMVLGRRDIDEYIWLLEYGFFTHWNHKHIIVKTDGHYRLLRNTTPEAQFVAEAPTLDALITYHNLPIQQFQWHPNWEEDPA